MTLAGALSVPLLMPNGNAFPERHQLVFLATGTILFTLIIGSIGLPLVLRRLPPAGEPDSVREERQARLVACQAAIAAIGDVSAGSSERQAPLQEALGRVTQDYRKRMDLLEEPHLAITPEAQADLPESVRQRRLRYVVELELRLKALHAERDALYGERQAHRINDASLRALVAELDMNEVSLGKRLDVARHAAGLDPVKKHQGH